MASATKTDLKTYAYTVRDGSGKTIDGELQAANKTQVTEKLQGMGYTPLKVDEVKQSLKDKELRIPGIGGKVKLKDLVVFSRQFSTMIASGLSLIRALGILAEQTENPAFSPVIEAVRDDVERGRELSDSLAEHPKVFPKLYIAMVRAGETAGMLDETLDRIATMLEADLKLRQKIKSAMTYPVIVFIMAIGLSAAMLIFIVPVFEDMFDDLGGELPLLTQALVNMSEFLTSWLGAVTFIVVPVALWQTYKKVRSSPSGRYRLDVLKLKVPVFGTLFHKVAMARFSRNLSTLLAAGVPILQALDITSETVNNGQVAAALQDVKQSVSQGETIAGPLSTHEVFPPMTVQMLAVGEETGNIDGMLNKVADFYDAEVETMTEQLTALMEPLMIAVIGAIVGGMVIALYMPMFGIFDLLE